MNTKIKTNNNSRLFNNLMGKFIDKHPSGVHKAEFSLCKKNMLKEMDISNTTFYRYLKIWKNDNNLTIINKIHNPKEYHRAYSLNYYYTHRKACCPSCIPAEK